MEDDVSPISTLPAEVLQHVFSLLGTKDLCTVTDVCRHWRALSRCPSLWRHRHVTAAEDRAYFLKILETAPELHSISVAAAYDVPGFLDLDQSATVCRTVRTLHVCQQLHYGLSDLALAVLRRYSPTVETLVVPAVTADILDALAASRRLRAFHLADPISPIYQSATWSRLRAALRTCSAPLEDLDLDTLDQGFGAAGLPDCITPSRLVREFVEAKGATLRRLMLPTTTAVITDDVLDEVARRCPQLESLGADFCDTHYLVKSLPRLRRLRLVGSLRLPSEEDIKDLQFAIHRARGTAKDAAKDSAVPLANVEHLTVHAGGQAENLNYTIGLARLCPRLRSMDLSIEAFDGIKEARLRELAAAARSAKTRLFVTTSVSLAAVTEQTVLSAMPCVAELRVNGEIVRGHSAPNVLDRR